MSVRTFLVCINFF